MADQALLNSIPSVDLAEFLSEDPTLKSKFVAELGAAFTNIGFVALKNHGLSDHLRDQLYSSVKDFFFQDDAIKQTYEFPELAGQRGYIGKNKETAKGFKKPDLKEFYHVGQLNKREGMPDNIFPKEVPAFEENTKETFKIFEATGRTLLKAIALYLKLPEEYFEAKVYQGDSILRALHYFPIDRPELLKEGAVRAAAHGDINLITLLMGASADGLQVLRTDGEWISVTALPDQIVINVGDMLDRLTNHKLKSTIHRVINPPVEKMKTSRFSIPFFMHPRAEMDLTSLESCIDIDNPKVYVNMTAGEFLEERLKELGLKK
ncbi:MAG: isopenicillin N synthase-like dioxygenase [Arcticibacterium sp.]|jgi:isopenicillin N synthase-like dioxygenase